MKFKKFLTLIAMVPLMSSATENQCMPRKSELIKYTCPTYIKNSSASSMRDEWQPENYVLNSKNKLWNINISYGNDFEPSKEGTYKPADGTTKLNHGYSIYRPYQEAGKWANDQSFYLQCHYKNSDLVLYKKISKEMRTCDVHFKKSKNLPLKKTPTGVAICSTSSQYIDKNEASLDCLIGQPVNK